eukprot:349682-Chlamydomonas_euryale.AAC.8
MAHPWPPSGKNVWVERDEREAVDLCNPCRVPPHTSGRPSPPGGKNVWVERVEREAVDLCDVRLSRDHDCRRGRPPHVPQDELLVVRHGAKDVGVVAVPCDVLDHALVLGEDALGVQHARLGLVGLRGVSLSVGVWSGEGGRRFNVHSWLRCPWHAARSLWPGWPAGVSLSVGVWEWGGREEVQRSQLVEMPLACGTLAYAWLRLIRAGASGRGAAHLPAPAWPEEPSVREDGAPGEARLAIRQSGSCHGDTSKQIMYL